MVNHLVDANNMVNKLINYEAFMKISPLKTVKRTQKIYRCSWCYEIIEKGAPCKTWFTYGENTTARMHLECCDAMQQAELYDAELPPAGTFKRGCSVEE